MLLQGTSEKHMGSVADTRQTWEWSGTFVREEMGMDKAAGDANDEQTRMHTESNINKNIDRTSESLD